MQPIAMKPIVKLVSTLFVLPILLFAACSNPADNVPEAKVADSAGPETPAPQTGGKLFAFTDSSTISFVGSKVTGSHDGGFKKFTGEFTVADGDPIQTVGAIEIDMESTWSDSDRLTGHLKNADFFDVENHPTTTFILDKVEKDGEQYKISGSLTLRGVTKAISFPAKIAMNENLATLQAEFFIKRFDFNIKYAGKADDLIRDEVVIKLDLKATPSA